jgi:hypothetical protein
MSWSPELLRFAEDYPLLIELLTSDLRETSWMTALRAPVRYPTI